MKTPKLPNVTKGCNCEFFKGRGRIHNKGILKILKEDIAWKYIFQFRNGRNITGIFQLSLLSSLMVIISRSCIQKGGTLIYMGKMAGV